MNKRLKLLTDRALCDLVSRLTGTQITYKKPLTTVQVKLMKAKIGVYCV